MTDDDIAQLRAELAHIRECLRQLLAFVDKIGGYTTPEQQAVIGRARAVLQ